MFDRLLRFSVRRPRLVVLLTAVVSVGVSVAIPRVELQLDGRSLIPKDHPWMEESDAEALRFAVRDMIVLGLEADRPLASRPDAIEYLAELTEEIQNLEGIEPASVASLTSVPRLVVQEGMLNLRPLIGVGRSVDARAAALLLNEARRLEWDRGLFVSSNLHAAAVFARIAPGADRYALLDAVDKLVARGAPDGVELFYTGNALAQAVLGNAAAADLLRLIPIVLLALCVILMVAFRHPAPALISLAEVAASLVWTVGLMGLTGQSVFVTTLALPVILVVIGVSDDLYVIHTFFEIRRRRGDCGASASVIDAFAKVGRPVLLTGMTTSAGLLCLVLPGLEPLRVFGVFGALSVLFSTLLTFTLVPALLVWIDPPAGKTRALSRLGVGLALALARLFTIVTPRTVLVGVSLLALGGVGYAVATLEVGDNWVRNLPPKSPIVVGDQRFNDLFAGTNTLDLSVSRVDGGPMFDPATFRALGQLEQYLKDAGSVGAVEGPFSATVRVAAALDEQAVADYIESDALERLLDDQRLLEEIVLLQESLRRNTIPLRWDDRRETAHVTVFVQSADYRRIANLLRLVREQASQSVPQLKVVSFGEGWVGYATIRLLVEGQMRSIFFALVFDLLLLSLFFRSIRASSLAIAPVALSVGLMFGVLALSGAQLGAANSMFAAISLGVGVDFAIHLVAQMRRLRPSERGRAESVLGVVAEAGPPILLSSVSMAAGFALLSVSSILPNRQLGLLVAASMLCCSFASLLVIPAWLFVRGRSSSALVKELDEFRRAVGKSTVIS